MEKYISIMTIMVGTWLFAIVHMIFQTGEYHPYIAAGFVLFGLLRLEDSLKKDLTS